MKQKPKKKSKKSRFAVERKHNRMTTKCRELQNIFDFKFPQGVEGKYKIGEYELIKTEVKTLRSGQLVARADNKIRIAPESEIFYPELEHHRHSHIPEPHHHRPRDHN